MMWQRKSDRKENKDIVPPRLEQAIKILGDKPSGSTGLTNWEAWIGFNRKP